VAKEVKMTKIIEIEGIGEKYAAALEGAGVATVEALLDTAGSASGRQALAEKTGVTPQRVLEWVNRADLMRIKGVGSEYSDLLEAAGVDTVKELATRRPDNLHAKLEEVNTAKSLVRRTPTAAEVEKWVAEAKTLPQKVTL
jgi:predicted flap endonuclease-1-like 5' DNA nuclease